MADAMLFLSAGVLYVYVVNFQPRQVVKIA